MTKYSFSFTNFYPSTIFGHASGRYWNNFLNYLWRNFPVGALGISQLAFSTFCRCLTSCTLAAHAPWYILLYVWVLFPLFSQVLLMLVCGKTPDKVDKAKGPKTFALGPLSLKLRWLVSKFFYCSYNKKSGKPSQLQRQNIPCLFLSPHIA